MWIEIIERSRFDRSHRSPPTRGCGLKSDELIGAEGQCGVTPHAGVWIEIYNVIHIISTALKSPPTRGCGLKCLRRQVKEVSRRSPPTRGCGLKFIGAFIVFLIDAVTPHTGVWIEIQKLKQARIDAERHPPRGGVD